MTVDQSPAFSFYAKDFMLGTVTMSLAERGAYITLLAYQWDRGSVPTDALELSRVLGCTRLEAGKLWAVVGAKFAISDDGACRNGRLEVERQKQTARRDALAANGRKGGRPPTNQKVTNSFPKTEPKQNQSESLPSPSPSPSPSPYVVPSELRRRSGQPPLSMGLRRLKIWRWMIEEFIGKLGEYADDFDLEAWIRDCDDHETRVIQGDWWDYWLPVFEAEVRRRALPVAATFSGKTTTRLAAALANIAAAEKP